ncbi:O-antigen ligase family protein [Priestia aryabhattai]|nr:O-antigen ligase family protein [Priestia aryabhattai]
MNYEQTNWEKVYKWVKIFIAINLLFCLYQVFFGSGISDTARGSGVTPSRNTFSMYLVFTFDFILILSFLLNKNKFSLLLITSVIIMEFLSFGRAGWAILGFSFILTLIYYRKIVVLLVTSLLTSGVVYAFWDKIIIRLQSGEGTSQHRENMANLLKYYGEQQPYFGYGFGWAQKFLAENPAVSSGIIQPHNDYVRLFVDIGYLGIALFIIPFLLIAFRCIKMLSCKDKKVKQIAFISLISVVQVLAFMKVYNAIDMYFASTMMVWLFVAILEMEYRKFKNKHLS